MTDSTQATSNARSSAEPQFYTPPPPPGDPPASITATQPAPGIEAPIQGESQAISTTQSNPFVNPEPQEPASQVPVAANPFNETAAVTQPNVPQEPPQHPGRPLPTGAVTETPLHSEPAPILPPRPQPESQVLPPPRASLDHPIPDHPAMQQSFDGAQSIQRVAMTPAQPQPVAPPPHAPTLDANPETLASDPAIASLHAMFPDFDLLVLQSVLEATGGDKDQAVDSLLSMSDPEYAQSQAQNAPAAPGARTGPEPGINPQGRQPTQTELDEEFARRLMLEEEQQANAGGWQPNNPYNHSVPYQQYQPRRSGDYQRPPSAGAGGGFGEIAGGLQQQFRNFVGGASTRAAPASSTQGGSGAGYQEQLNRIADTGKKTFNTIFTKVKQKMEEFDNRNPPDTQNMNQPPQSGHWSNWQGPPARTQQQQVPTFAQSPAPGQYPRPAQSPPAHHGALNSNPYHIPETTSTTANAEPNSLPRSSGRWQYQPEGPESLPDPPAPTVGPSAEEPRRSVDAARLGLLPKRPVSLMDVNANTRTAQPQPQPQPQPVTHAHDSDNDSLEYVDRPMPGAMARPS